MTPTTCQARPPIDELRRLIDSGQNIWIDIEAPDRADYQLLIDGLGFHPLTVEDIQHEGQRPKIEAFSGYDFAVLFVARWASDELDFFDRYIYLAERLVVTVHHQAAPALQGLQARLAKGPGALEGRPGFLTYLVIDAIVDELFPVLDRLDDEIDLIEDRVASVAASSDLARLTRIKHDVIELRRRLGAQRDLFQRLLTQSNGLIHGDLSLYYRDIHDHVVRQYEMVDSLRDLLSSALDVYLSTVSNRLNITVKQLTVIASLFLPLTFLTGFFGMNFAYLVNELTSFNHFIVGVAIMGGSVIIQLFFFKRRGWI